MTTAAAKSQPSNVAPGKPVVVPKSRVTSKQHASSFFRRHQVGIAVTAATAAVLWGIWLAISAPRPFRPEDFGRNREVNDGPFVEATRRLAQSWSVGTPLLAELENLTLADVGSRLGGAVWSGNMRHAPRCPSSLQLADLPRNFDSRQKRPDCEVQKSYPLHTECSASWAVAAADSISSRLCWSDSAKFSGLRMSPQTLLSCVPDVGSCQGGAIDAAMVVAMKHGLTSTVCFPFTAEPNVHCSSGCIYEERTRIEGFCKMDDGTHIKAELFERGPVAVVVTLTDDLLLYEGGVYSPTPLTQRLMTAQQPVTYAAVLLGWGVEEGKEFWLVQFDFGPAWGEDGVAKIAREPHIVLENGAVAPIVMWPDETPGDDADEEIQPPAAAHEGEEEDQEGHALSPNAEDSGSL